MLHVDYTPTDPHAELQSALSHFAVQLGTVPIAGAYDNGLLAVVDLTSSTTLLSSWSWLLGNNCCPLITTGFGDVFFWNSNGVHFLDVQRGTTELVDADVSWFLSVFLVNPDVVERVLKKTRFEQLVVSKDPLKYHQIFILVPWLMLGGVEQVENYDEGACSVYLDLAGQSLRRSD